MDRWFLSRLPLRMVALAALVAPAAVHAQRPASPPATPAAAPVPAPADEEFRSWALQRESDPPEFAPPRTLGGRYDVLLLPARLRESVIGDSLHASFARFCRVSLPNVVLEADSLLASLDAWAAFDSAAAAVPLVAVQVTPTRGGATDCGARPAEHVASLARGTRFGSDTVYSRASDARTAELWVDGRRVEPVLAASVPVLHVSGLAVWRDSTRQLRLYVPADAFAPTEATGWPRAELRVWDATDAAPTVVPLGRAMLERAWHHELAWRAARLAPRAATTPRVELPVAQDPAIAGAVASLQRGEVRVAAAQAHARLEAKPAPSAADARIGRIALALALEAGGDTVGSRGALGLAVSADPCLTLGPGLAERHGRPLDAARPAARCETSTFRQVATRALIPGFAQLGTERRGMGYTVAAFVATSAALSFVSESHARSAYRDYENTVLLGNQVQGSNFDDIVLRHYNEATEARSLGNTMRAVAIGIWAAAGVEALLFERRHAARVRAVTGIGRDATGLSVVPLPHGRVGVALRITP